MIFADGFESGSLSAWSSAATDGGDLSVSAAAALVGGYGLEAVIDDNVAIYVTDDRPLAEPRYRARFYFDPNAIPMAGGNAHYIFYGYTGTSTVVLRVEFRFSSGNYQLRAALRNDGSGWTNTGWFTISDALHFVEVDWRAATAAGANDGGLTLWIDDVPRASLSGIDNDTRRIDRVRLGAVAGVDSGTRGTYFFDAFESRQQTYIGPDPDLPPTATPTITPTGTPTQTPTVTNTPLPTNTPTATRTPGGNFALAFDGSNDEVRAGQVVGTGPLTVEAWVRPATNSANAILVAGADSSTGWSLELNSGLLTFWVSTNQGWQFNRHTMALQGGQWYHVAATYGSGTARTFVNGSASGSTSVGTLTQGPFLRFGGLSGFSYFNGALDEVRLSNILRYTASFTPPTAPFTSDADTLGLWHFDEGSGQVAADASAAGNNATLGTSSSSDSADPIWVEGFQ